jgi:hypothetical protein
MHTVGRKANDVDRGRMAAECGEVLYPWRAGGGGVRVVFDE